MISHRPAFETRPRRAAFTLIELLAVLVVVGILMAVAIPAVTGIGKGSSLQAATSNVRSTISFARQWAITRRTNVYVVFPRAGTPFVSEQDAALANRGYAVYEVSNTTTGDGQYITDWKMLPSGIIFDSLNADGSSVFQRSTLQRRARFPQNSSALPAADNVSVLWFRPTGKLATGTVGGRIFLREGLSMPSGSTPSVTPLGSTQMRLEVNPFSGAVRVVDDTP